MLSANRCQVQRFRPLGALRQAKAIRWASLSPSNFLWPGRERCFRLESGLQAIFDTGFTGTFNRLATDVKGLVNVLIGPSGALWALIRLQQNAGPREFVSGRFSFGDQAKRSCRSSSTKVTL